MLRVDLQLHSRFSDRPSEWIFRRLGMPQSYSEPEALYRKLHAAGKTFKTITAHYVTRARLHNYSFLSIESARARARARSVRTRSQTRPSQR